MNKSRSKGFTLIEIIVVIVVISVITSTILLNTRLNRPEAKLKNYAEAISDTLGILIQEAILEDINYAISVQPGSFVVLEYNGEDWLPSKDRFFQNRSQVTQYEDELEINEQLVAIEKKEKPDPHILVLSDGQMTPFVWDIKDREHDVQIRLTGSVLGKVVMEGPTGSFL